MDKVKYAFLIISAIYCVIVYWYIFRAAERRYFKEPEPPFGSCRGME